MARGKKKTRLGLETNPEVSREVLAASALLIGIVLLLGLFGLGGRIGDLTAQGFGAFFGVMRFLFPVLLIGLGIGLFVDKLQFRPASSVAIMVILLALPALVTPYGGAVGQGVFEIFQTTIGQPGTYVTLVILSLIATLILTNTSLKTLVGYLKFDFLRPRGALEPRASVFETVRTAVGSKGQATAVALPTIAAGAAGEDWHFPPLNLLELSTTKPNAGNIMRNVEIISKTLKDFNIVVAMGDVNIGPTVTQYTLKPDEGVRLNQITARVNDLALALAAHPIRIEAPIPGKAAVGIEVPNKTAATVTLRELLESNEFKALKFKLALCLGRDVAGKPFLADLEKMPHLLIAGATGSGKSVAINAMLSALLYQHSPVTLRLILIDPKRVEFTQYNGVPHLLVPVITEIQQTISALRWAVAEMERRFKVFSSAAKRNIEAYNQSSQAKMPYIVIVIDELADLMAQSANEVEAAIVRLAQMARATGIHLIVATQRPSVDVITGLIKANITTRLAFAVASQVDSRTILDVSGSEKLLGNGDLLLIGNEFGKPKRLQGAMVSDREIQRVTDFLKEQSSVSYDESILSYHAPSQRLGAEGAVDDELFDEAKQLVIQAGKASASLLQRRLRIGYARAARLLDLLEEEGMIGGADGARPRDVLTPPDFEPPSTANPPDQSER